MADRRSKICNYGSTQVIRPKFTLVEDGSYSKPDSMAVVLSKGATTVALWSAGVDDEIVEIKDSEDQYMYYQIYVDTTLFTEPCEGVVTITATYTGTPDQNVVAKARYTIL